MQDEQRSKNGGHAFILRLLGRKCKWVTDSYSRIKIRSQFLHLRPQFLGDQEDRVAGGQDKPQDSSSQRYGVGHKELNIGHCVNDFNQSEGIEK